MEGQCLTSTEQWNGAQDLTFGSDDQEAKERLRELMLFIADRCENEPTFGATKLNKILFYADFMSYALYGEPITGVTYKKLDRGPVPTVLKLVRDEMEVQGDIVVKKSSYHNLVQHRVISLREANLKKLKARDIKLVDEVIQALSKHNASEVSELSHNRAWQIPGYGEPIPYEAAFLSDREPTERDIARARELSSEYGWDV
jgi:hypothetical protein